MRRIVVVIAATVALTVTAAVGEAGLAQASQPAGARVASSAGVLDEPSPSDQDQLRIVAAAIWGQDLANGWDMNTDVANVLSDATHAILTCSAAFSLVPKPPGWVPGITYLVKYALNLRNYFLAVSGNRTYAACVSGTALNYRSAMEIASAGV
ncbi:hypothetical protein [Amycolatopsis pigmentata]|uniref:Uncharacterized protein n=1 Tax=Amycolatopsis pigmentata TaxID=450801 RepID=A0ABW5FKQ3_9PSEU